MHVPEMLSNLLRCCLVSLSIPTVGIADFQICFGARNLNEERRSIILQRKHFPTRLQIHSCVEFSQNVDQRMLAIISLKVRNPGIEVMSGSGFRMIIIVENDHAASQDRSTFQLNCGIKHLTAAFDFRGYKI